MTAATIPQTHVTPAAPAEGDLLYEVVNGQIVENPPMGAFESWVASRLMRAIISFDPGERFGQVVIEMLFLIDRAAGLQRRPDVAFVSSERWPRNRPVPKAAAWDVVPDLAIEVNSPSNTGGDLLIKMHEYFRAGVRQVWIVHPETSEVYVYDAPTRIRVLAGGDALEGGTILPGFQLPVTRLFEGEPQDA